MSQSYDRIKKIDDTLAFIYKTIFIIILIVGSIIFYVTKVEKRDISTSTSPDGLYTLQFQQVGDPAWPFGSATVKITVKGVKNIKD